ncbi:MAG: alpha/beta fold hydrolase [Streptosporangiaceae bacterium]|nr:alpha/beta fold hydrolase [Streptosporangiaceae bacterium]MBV9855654.1 alpha/beta fold hydrolase [Streptosporangiaceae bacterium]
MDFQRRKIRVNGIDMSVVVAGEGQDVLLVHGFPDTHRVWRHVIPALVSAGYRVIAPDTRGCGDTEMPAAVSAYRIEALVADLAGLLDVLGIQKVRLVAHDWGAAQAWRLVLDHPQRVDRYVALSVGHPAAYSHGGLAQKLKGYYILLFQLRGVTEFLATRLDWLLFRMIARYPEEMPEWRAALSRPGRLTAGLNYYRANPGLAVPREYPAARVPVFGIWSTGDLFLTEAQMVGSQRYMNAPWRYERIEGANHWIPLSAPGKLNPLLLEFLGAPGVE